MGRHQRVCAAIAAEIGVPEEQVDTAVRLREDLWLDAFDVAELIVSLESAFERSIPDEALSTLETVGDVERLIA